MRYQRKKQLVIAAIIASGILGFGLSLHEHRLHSPIISVPQGAPVMQTQHYPALFVQQLKGDRQAGKKIFKEFCASCHAENPAIETKAPLLTDHQAWQAIRDLGMPMLLRITVRGLGAMPARGGCFECSDEQLQQTIQYMLDQAK